MRPYLLALAALLLAALTLRRRFALVTVIGDSMVPALAPGDRVLVRRAGIRRLRRGQVVVVEAPDTDGYHGAPPHGTVGRRDWMIKRVAAVPGDARPADSLPATAGPPGRLVPPGRFVVLGDNAAWSHDSRQIGYIPGDRLLGIVIRGIRPDGDPPDLTRSLESVTGAGPARWSPGSAGPGWRIPPAAR